MSCFGYLLCGHACVRRTGYDAYFLNFNHTMAPVQGEEALLIKLMVYGVLISRGCNQNYCHLTFDNMREGWEMNEWNFKVRMVN